MRAAGFTLVQSAKRRLKSVGWLQSMPLVRYTYLFDLAAGIVVPELGLCFIPTPKAANRSIKATIASVVRPGYRGDPHLAGWQYRPASLLRQTGYYSFAFVRNPLDRLYSCYAQKIVFYSRMRKLPILFWRYGDTFHPDMTFEEFVKVVADIPDAIADRHFRSQHRFLYRRNKPVVDDIFHFETLGEDWETIRRRFGLPALEHHNRSPRSVYTEAYTPELARIAARRYEKDIRLFGYEEEVKRLA